jgi:putative cardiolipin synthase
MRKLITASLILFPLIASAINHSDSIPYPFYSEDTSGETQMMPLHRGEESLQIRLEMIRKAQKSIDVEYYIYYKDMAGKIFNRELVKAAQRGIKIRILLDKFSSGMDSFTAHELTRAGMEVKFYNTNFVLKLGAINYRNHRKIFIVDGEEAITGGRNLADDYFNLDHDYNYEDRDVFVKGPIVKSMKDSFDAFFNHEISHEMKRPERPTTTVDENGEYEGLAQQKNWIKKVKEAKEFFQETREELAIRAEIEKTGTAQLADNNMYPCPEATFVSDAPGKRGNLSVEDYQQSHRNVRKTFLDKILPIDKAITLSSPYFIPNERNEFIFEELLKKGVEFNLYSNSLRSTDALFMSASLYMKLPGFLKKGMKVYFNDGDYAHMDASAVGTAKSSKWGTHAKTHVYETSTYTEVMIGTYNVDNRSDYYNTELALFCKGNDDFSRDVKADIMKLASRGLRVEDLTHAYDRTGAKINITGASPIKRLKMKLLTIPSWLISHLL